MKPAKEEKNELWVQKYYNGVTDKEIGQLSSPRVGRDTFLQFNFQPIFLASIDTVRKSPASIISHFSIDFDQELTTRSLQLLFIHVMAFS